jgi:hypothetical protein
MDGLMEEPRVFESFPEDFLPALVGFRRTAR